MHISTINGAKIQKFARELAQTMVTWLESQVNSSLVAFFVNNFPLNIWHAMFGIFPRHYITYHYSMHRFSIFLILLDHL
jgi:hypothetical protein